MRVFFLDVGHRHKGEKLDPGAQHKGLSEIVLAGAYVQQAKLRLESLGYAVELVPEGHYYERHAWALKVARERYAGVRGLYLQCHINAHPNGTYALVRPDYRSKWGASAARTLATAIDAALPEVLSSRNDELYPDFVTANKNGRSTPNTSMRSWWTRGWECIDGIYASDTLCGAIIEPGFIDNAAHAALWTPEGLIRVGDALAQGCAQWAQSIA